MAPICSGHRTHRAFWVNEISTQQASYASVAKSLLASDEFFANGAVTPTCEIGRESEDLANGNPGDSLIGRHAKRRSFYRMILSPG